MTRRAAHGRAEALKGPRPFRQETCEGMGEGSLAAPVVAAEPADVAELYRQHAETVARWVARLGGPLMDVEDAVHEVFVVAQRRRPSEEGAARITTWLYRVTAKVVSHRRRKERIRRWLRGSARDVAGDIPAGDRSPVDVLAAREKAALVYRVLDRLPERHRAVLILFEMEGLSGEEIAKLHGARVSTVWVWLHRARAAFLAELARVDRTGGGAELGRGAREGRGGGR
jgi:RNA polymerase sigma-70 factor, ECF subfamily